MVGYNIIANLWNGRQHKNAEHKKLQSIIMNTSGINNISL